MSVGRAMPPPMAMAPSPAAPPAAGAPPPRKADSFFEKLARGVSDLFAAAPEEDLERGEGSNVTLLRGIIRINNEKRLAISFTLKNGIDWQLPDKAKIQLEGQELEVEVEREHSTQSGRLGYGAELRLVLKLTNGALPSKPIAIVLTEQGIAIELVA